MDKRLKSLQSLLRKKLPQEKNKFYQCKTFIMLNSRIVLNLKSSCFMKGIGFKDDHQLMHQAVA